MGKQLKRRQGVVVSRSGDKTVKVSIQNRKRHPFYKKVLTKTSFVLVHDEKNEASVGDTVSFVSCRPLSAKKCWRIVSEVVA